MEDLINKIGEISKRQELTNKFLYMILEEIKKINKTEVKNDIHNNH